ncbi:MAG: DNA-formamidopyrimidine glycosylase [Thermodesulfobacteriota bacterium]
MPELPEVETIVRDLRSLVTGRRVKKVQVKLPKLVNNGSGRLARLLTGSRITSAHRRGKFIVLALSNQAFFIVHLKMTGQFLFGPVTAAWPEHVHLRIAFDDGQELLYRDIRQFGRMLALTYRQYNKWLEEEPLGPDPLKMSASDFVLRLRTRRGRIKPLLLNQAFISGLGNIYTDEALFQAGIHPLCPAESLPEGQVRLLHEKMVRLLEEAIALRGSTTSNYVGLKGVGGQFQNKHQVYGKTGQDCPRCGHPIKRLKVAGRGTHFCPRCQPEP